MCGGGRGRGREDHKEKEVKVEAHSLFAHVLLVLIYPSNCSVLSVSKRLLENRKLKSYLNKLVNFTSLHTKPKLVIGSSGLFKIKDKRHRPEVEKILRYFTTQHKSSFIQHFTPQGEYFFHLY